MKFKYLVVIPIAGVLSLASCNLQKNMKKDSVSLKTQLDTVSYSLGVNIGQSIKEQGLDSLNSEVFVKAIEDVMNKDSLLVSNQQAFAVLSQYFQTLQTKKVEKNKQEGEKFLSENKAKEGIQTTPSGLQYKVLQEGTGPTPKATDTVTVHYTGKLIDGTVFDSSTERGQPIAFPVNGVIPGWTEALQLMKVGSKWQLFVPSDLAYGERGAGRDIGPNSTLIFDVELLAIGDKTQATQENNK